MIFSTRRALGLTQDRFATAAGFSDTTLSRIEQAQRDGETLTIEQTVYDCLARFLRQLFVGDEGTVRGNLAYLRTTDHGKKAGGYGAPGKRRARQSPGVCGICQYELPASGLCGSDVCS